jgi:hypothetical protein
MSEFFKYVKTKFSVVIRLKSSGIEPDQIMMYVLKESPKHW